jgi:hypothetical protein
MTMMMMMMTAPILTSGTDVTAARCDWIDLFWGAGGKPTSHLGGSWLHNNEEVKIAFREWLRIQKPTFHSDRIFQLVPKMGKYMNSLWD